MEMVFVKQWSDSGYGVLYHCICDSYDLMADLIYYLSNEYITIWILWQKDSKFITIMGVHITFPNSKSYSLDNFKNYSVEKCNINLKSNRKRNQ